MRLHEIIEFIPAALFKLAAIAIVPFAAFSVNAAEFDPGHTTLVEERVPEPTMVFDYRLFPEQEVTKTEVDCDGTAMPFQATPWYDNQLNVSALLVLVDTSAGQRNLPRDRSIEANKAAINGILGKARPNLLIGLYKFANDLTELTPIGAPIEKTREAAAKLTADGMGTRLYRSAIEAAKKLSATQAERKALLIFSDGKDEDTGFTLNDLISEAKKLNVIVLAVGCPESQQDIPSLGNLERLAAETLGVYAQTELVSGRPGLPLGQRRIVPKNPDGLVDKLIGSLVGGGQVVAATRSLNPRGKIKITVTTKDGQKLSQTLDRGAAAPPPSPSGSPTNAASPANASITNTNAPGLTPAVAKPKPADNKLLVVAIVGALVAISGILGLAVLLSSRRKKDTKTPLPPDFDFGGGEAAPTILSADREAGAAQGAPGRTLARLMIQDAESSVLHVKKTATRIGRRPDNDIVFSNDSVSGHHAVLHMGRDGTFSITDTNSGNGVLVNGQRIQQANLEDGDVVELGEVRFHFKTS